jgi:hypothetical protein
MSEKEKTKESSKTVAVGEMKIRLPEDVAAGTSANLAMINHSPEDFMLDFNFVQPGGKQAEVRSRIILTPGHYKRLLAAMQQNLQRYEQAFGPIPERTPQVPTPTGPIN